MEGSRTHNSVLQEVCDLKHKSSDVEIQDLKDAIENITNPSSGHIAVAKDEMEKKIDKLDSKINGLIMFIATTITGAVISIGAEFFKGLLK